MFCQMVIRGNAGWCHDKLPYKLLPLTSELRNWPLFRITVDPSRHNGLLERSQIIVDKATTLPRRKVGRLIGRLDDHTMRRVDRALARFLGWRHSGRRS